MVRAGVSDYEVDVVNELQAISVVVKQTVLVLSPLVSRRLGDAINGRLVNVRVNDDANASLGRVCQGLLIVLAFGGFFANFRGGVYLFFNR